MSDAGNVEIPVRSLRWLMLKAQESEELRELVELAADRLEPVDRLFVRRDPDAQLPDQRSVQRARDRFHTVLMKLEERVESWR